MVEAMRGYLVVEGGFWGVGECYEQAIVVDVVVEESCRVWRRAVERDYSGFGVGREHTECGGYYWDGKG